MYLLFKSNNQHHYANGLLETLVQREVLPESLSQSLIYNRFVNTQGCPNTNIPADLYVEHQNRTFKNELKTYRGKITQKHLDRISKAQNIKQDIIETLDADLERHSRSQHSRITVPGADINLLMKKMAAADLFSESQTARTHSPQLQYIQNPMMRFKKQDFKQFVNDQLTELKLKNVYKQFSITTPISSIACSESPLRSDEQVDSITSSLSSLLIDELCS